MLGKENHQPYNNEQLPPFPNNVKTTCGMESEDKEILGKHLKVKGVEEQFTIRE